MAVDKQSLELLEATKELKRAASTLNAAGKQFTSDGLVGTGINKIADKIGAKGALEFVMKRKQLRTQDKLLRQELGLRRGQLKDLKKRQKIAEAEEQRQKAFKSLSENLLGLSEQQRQKLVNIKESKDRGDGRDSSGRFVGKMTPEAVISGALKEANKENARVAKKSGKSPGDKNRAAEEERTRDQQAFEMEKTESTNEILRDILAALTGSGIEKKEEGGGIGGGLFAGLLGAKGLGALKKAIGGVTAALGTAALAGGKGAAKAGKGLLGKLGGLARIVGPGMPLLLGLTAAAGAFLLLKDRSEEFRKKVEEDTARIREDIKNAKTTAEVAEAGAGTRAQAVNQEAERQARLAGGQTESQAQESATKGEVLVDRFKEKNVIESSQDFNEIIRNSTAFFNATRDAAVRQGSTLQERYDFFDRQIADVLTKVESSAAFLKADKAGQQAMIGQVIAAANKSITGAGRKSQFLRGLSPEEMKNQAAIEGRRTRTFSALQYGATGQRLQDALSHMSDLMGGGRNRYSMRRVSELEAEVAQAQKDADEVTFLERNNPFGSGNQGDIDRLNNLTKELERLRDTIAAADRYKSNIPPVIAPNNSTTTVNNSSASVTHPIHMTDQNTSSVVQYP